MPGNKSNLSTVDGQQAAAAAATVAKRNEDNATVVAQSTVATMHREQQALIAIMATTSKTLDEARACKCAATIAWDNSSPPRTSARRYPRDCASLG
jgi:hypothetical protein